MYFSSSQATPFYHDVYGYSLVAYSQDSLAPQAFAISLSSSGSSTSSSNSSPRIPSADLPESTSTGVLEPEHIPRPRNPFIIFRSQFASELKSREVHHHQNLVSRSAADVWNALTEEEKLPYKLQADNEKFEHCKKYPNYVYTPGSRAAKRASSRRAKHSNKPYSMVSRITSKGSTTRNATTPHDVPPSASSEHPPFPTMCLAQMLANYILTNMAANENSADHKSQRLAPQLVDHGFRPELACTTPTMSTTRLVSVDSTEQRQQLDGFEPHVRMN